MTLLVPGAVQIMSWARDSFHYLNGHNWFLVISLQVKYTALQTLLQHTIHFVFLRTEVRVLVDQTGQMLLVPLWGVQPRGAAVSCLCESVCGVWWPARRSDELLLQSTCALRPEWQGLVSNEELRHIEVVKSKPTRRTLSPLRHAQTAGRWQKSWRNVEQQSDWDPQPGCSPSQTRLRTMWQLAPSAPGCSPARLLVLGCAWLCALGGESAALCPLRVRSASRGAVPLSRCWNPAATTTTTSAVVSRSSRQFTTDAFMNHAMAVVALTHGVLGLSMAWQILCGLEITNVRFNPPTRAGWCFVSLWALYELFHVVCCAQDHR